MILSRASLPWLLLGVALFLVLQLVGGTAIVDKTTLTGMGFIAIALLLFALWDAIHMVPARRRQKQMPPDRET